MASETPCSASLLIACPDGRGIVAAVSGFIAEHGGNLLASDQHTDLEHSEFFMRIKFELHDCDLNRSSFNKAWQPLADRFNMNWQVHWSEDIKRMAIMVGKQAHCLQDLIWRWQAGELNVHLPMIISNHSALESIAKDAGIEFRHCPIVDNNKNAQEEIVKNIIDEANIDLVVLARYMQILSPQFLDGYEGRVINIHHSFLPAFAGGDPYRQAYDRGVKIIGATSHYVTDDLDDGPIITQEVVDVSHRDSVDDLRRKGRDLERTVLARAVRYHVQDKILVSQNKTVVFE